ncbi:uncharacterized protein SCODWIG_02152 [Saccharomycodes ludwigii]|uniref:Sister chromatid cohesion protein n=1 Tax=Saccharomycodes ludwigii TaxID=36035 RepID=A0A376B6Y6_9ASCO|nr:hypothetical protein SCDLUD_001853 [Saccharomycodes ludwigii]KAH3902042.1 hypothetical protein SCDLUD_001853 [Saccharomycodes ludwigii]SSD60391.1 uncharacterized protein SCODWIG_02152 [Saccharomycodes ludwigii]
MSKEAFPGVNDKNIPKRISTALTKQPFTNVVPKSELPYLIDPSRHSVFSLTSCHDILDPAPEFLYNHYPHRIELEAVNNVLNEHENNLKFKKPNLKLEPKTGIEKEEEENVDLFDGLSDLAKRSITDIVELDQIIQTKETNVSNIIITETNNKKHKTEDMGMEVETSKKHHSNSSENLPNDSISKIDFDIQKPNSVEGLKTQFIEKFVKLSQICVKKDFNNLTFWIKLSNHDNVITTMGYLDDLKLLISEALNNEAYKNLISEKCTNNLFEILLTCSNNLEVIERNSAFVEYNNIAFVSSTIIFLSFQLGISNKKLYLKDFIVRPIDCFAKFIKDVLEKDDYSPTFEDLSFFKLSLLSFYDYLKKGCEFDEPIISKIVYGFVELFSKNSYILKFTTNSAKSQSCWDSIKFITSDILTSLFKNFPTQREFIIDNITPYIDALPSTRSQKKLLCVNSSTGPIYITHFTYTIMCLLQSSSISPSMVHGVNFDQTAFHELELAEQEWLSNLDMWVERITSAILAKVFDNIGDLKPCIEQYTNDLMESLFCPDFPVCEWLATNLFRKCLYVFNPSENHPVNIEASALGLLSIIGSKILDIRLKSQEHNDIGSHISLITLFNYPQKIPIIIKNFSLFRKFFLSNPDKSKFFWSMEIHTLMKLHNFKEEESQEWSNTIKQYLQESLEPVLDKIALDAEEYLKPYTQLLQCLSLVTLYEPYLKLLLSLIDSAKIRLRSGAIKCFSNLISRDKYMIELPMIQDTINKMLRDPSASVRGNILDIIENSINITSFYRQINWLYNDDSVSVRKRVLNLNKIIFNETTDPAIASFVICYILRKTEDEEDIIVEQCKEFLLRKIFLDIDDLNDNHVLQEEKCKYNINIICNILTSSEKCKELFDFFLHFYVLNAESHKPNENKCINESIKRLTEVIISELIDIQQAESEDLQKKYSIMEDNLLLLLSMISSSSGSFVTREQLFALYPFLSTTDNIEIRLNTLRIFNSALKKLSTFRPKFLFDLETFLLSNLTKMTSKELDEAIPLAWSVATQKRDYMRITKACSSCLNHFSEYIKLGVLHPEKITVDGKLQRLLYMSTGFARYCDFKNTAENFPTLKTRESIYAYVTKCLLVFTGPQILSTIKKIAIKNLVGLCSSHPKLFNSDPVLKVFDEVFNSDATDVKIIVIECLYTFFTAQEWKTIQNAGVNGTNSSSLELKEKVLSNNKLETFNDGICSALVTRYLAAILKMCLLKNFDICYPAVKFLDMIDKYEYVNPSAYIYILISLLTCPSKKIKKIAEHTVKRLVEKHESMVYSGLNKGFTTAVVYNKEKLPVVEEYLFLDLQNLLCNNKRNINKFLTIVKKVFTKTFALNKDKEITNYNGLLFLAKNILHLKFPDIYTVYEFTNIIGNSASSYHCILHENDNNDSDKSFKLVMAVNILENLNRELYRKFSLDKDFVELVSGDNKSTLKEVSITNHEKDAGLNFAEICYNLDPEKDRDRIAQMYFSNGSFIDRD